MLLVNHPLRCVVAAGIVILAGQSLVAQDVEEKQEVKSLMLSPWSGPYGGVPPWNLVRREEFVEAFEAAIERSAQEINVIADNPEPATFENTVVAMEDSGRELSRLSTLFFVHASNLNVGPIPDIEKVVVPKLSEHEDSIYQNEKLFARIAAVFEGDEMKSGKLDAAQQRLVDDRYKTFLRKGAKLSKSDKAKLSQINTRLARLFTDFSQNVLEDEKGFVTWIDDEADLRDCQRASQGCWRRACSSLLYDRSPPAVGE